MEGALRLNWRFRLWWPWQRVKRPPPMTTPHVSEPGNALAADLHFINRTAVAQADRTKRIAVERFGASAEKIDIEARANSRGLKIARGGRQ